MTRTENSTKNMYTGLIYQVLVLVFRFITRTVFIKCLGTEYLGINGLFSNILTLLSLADLGIGGALVYSLYEPIAKKDEARQKVIVQYLHKLYIIIGIAILVIGIVLLPFLKYIIKDNVTFININLVFLVYVFQTASTYLFFPSKVEFLCANQKRYLYNKIANIIVILSNLAQILILVIFKNFYLYLFTVIMFNIFQAYLVSRKTNKLYPFITKKTNKQLTKEEKKNIFKDCGSLMIYRMNYIVLTATDNIIISKYLGLNIVGLYSNYVLITNSITNILSTFFDSISASIGDLQTNSTKDKDYKVFKLTNFITAVCFGIFSVGIYVLANDFIKLWLGDAYILSTAFVAMISINLYIEGLRKFLSTYRTTHGLFRETKFVPLVGMIINIVASIILVKKIGLLGVLLGTFISNMLTFMWVEPYIIYKKVFHKNPFKYYIRNIIYIIFFIVMALICGSISNITPINGILGFVIDGIISVFIPLIIIILIYYKSEYVEYFKNVFNMFKKKVVKKND